MIMVTKTNEKAIAAIVQINELVNIPWRKSDIIALLEQENCKLFYIDHAYVFIRYVFDEAEILNIAVHPKFFGQGLAQLLWEHVVLFFHHQQIIKCFLEVRASNHRARRFYEKNKFKMIGSRKNYYQNPKEDAVIYEWVR